MDYKKDINQPLLNEQSQAKGHATTMPNKSNTTSEQTRASGMAFVLRKSEKLTTALYLVTDIMSEREPMKWKMRESAVDLLADLTSSQGGSMGEKMATLNIVLKKIERLVAFLEIAQASHLISEMNASVLKKEYIVLKNTIEGEWSSLFDQTRELLSDTFFAVPKEPAIENAARTVADNKRHEDQVQYEVSDKRQDSLDTAHVSLSEKESTRSSQQKSISQGQQFIQNISPEVAHSPMHSRTQEVTPFTKTTIIRPEVRALTTAKNEHYIIRSTPQEIQKNSFAQMEDYPLEHAKNDIAKNDRRTIILTLIKQKPAIMVKDITKSIPAVSEKTIQRELLAMVADGVLVKRGERRWSTYSLR